MMTKLKTLNHVAQIALLLVWFAYTNNARALANESPIDLPNDCTIYWHQLAGPVTVYRTEGTCKNGLAEGVWTFGGGTSEGTKFLSMSGRKAGRASGVIFLVSSRGLATIRVTDPDIKDHHFGTLLNRGEATEQLESFLTAIHRANAVARQLGLPTINAEKAKAIVRTWHQGSDSIFDQWVSGPGTTPPWEYGVSKSSRFPQNAAPSPALSDDPKTTGRGAVHPEELERRAQEANRLAREAEQLRIQREEAEARKQREKEAQDLRELQELTNALQQLSNTLKRK